MSEKIRLHETQQQKAEIFKPPVSEAKNHPINHSEIEKESNEALQDNIEQIRQAVEKNSDSAHEKTKKAEHLKPSHEKVEHRHYITKKIKSDKFKQTMSDVRQQLSKPDRVFSKIIHQPIIESASEIGAKTIARPGGILTGGVVGLFGSILTLFYAKNIGFEVPVSVYPMLFTAGYLIGLFIEFSYKLLTKNKQKRNSLSYK